MIRRVKVVVAGLALSIILGALVFHTSANLTSSTLSAPFERKVLGTLPEAPFNLRFFTTAVKTHDSHSQQSGGGGRYVAGMLF